jgi:hypothetical protein
MRGTTPLGPWGRRVAVRDGRRHAGVLNGGTRSIDDMATRKSQQQEKGGGMDAVALLKKDHDEVNKMFEEFESADEDRKFELAAEICQALTVPAGP